MAKEAIEKAGVIHKIYHTASNGIPITNMAEQFQNSMKFIQVNKGAQRAALSQ